MTTKETQSTLRGPLEKQLDLVVTRASSRKNKAFLMVSAGEAAGTVFPLADTSVLIGRSLDAQVCINEQAISYEHARLDQDQDTFKLRDLGSTNGTYVNGQRLVDAVVLVSGDSIRMGSTTFTFVTRESGVPKGTVRLRDPNPEAPIEPSRRRRGSSGVAPTEQTGSISLTDVVRTVRTYWVYARRYGVLLGACLSFGVTLGLVQGWLRPPAGAAWFEMTLASPVRANEEDGPQFFLGAESTFRSLPLIKRTLTELGAPQVSDTAATNIQSALSFERVGYNSDVYRGEFEDATPELAVTFLKKHVQVYVDSELDKILQVLRTDAAFDREQAEEAARRVDEARGRLIAFGDEHPEAVPKDAKLPGQVAARLAPGASPERIRQSIVSMERALRAAYGAIQSKKARPYLEQVTETEAKIAEARARGLRDQHPELKALLNLRAAMRAKANAVLAAEPSASEQSLDPQVMGLKQELDMLRARLDEAESATPRAAGDDGSASAGLTTQAPRKVDLAADARPAPAARSLAQLKILYAELAREYERAKTEHEALMKKREATDRLLERERTSAEARYDIITPPTAEKRSLLAALVKRGGLGGMLGLGLALVAAACLELRRTLIARGHIRA